MRVMHEFLMFKAKEKMSESLGVDSQIDENQLQKDGKHSSQ